jgi:hypothetical protein
MEDIMRLRRTLSALLIGSMAFIPVPVLAADDAATRRDLFTVIALQGLPCGEVVSVASRGDNDHVATCRDGNRYRVFLNTEGRVVVQKQ